MTDIPRGQGGDGSPQLDLDAAERQARIQQNIRAHLRDCDAENDALRGRVEELTALVERMLKIRGDDYDALVAADYETADGLHELAEEAWVTDAEGDTMSAERISDEGR